MYSCRTESRGDGFALYSKCLYGNSLYSCSLYGTTGYVFIKFSAQLFSVAVHMAMRLFDSELDYVLCFRKRSEVIALVARR